MKRGEVRIKRGEVRIHPENTARRGENTARPGENTARRDLHYLHTRAIIFYFHKHVVAVTVAKIPLETVGSRVWDH